MRKVRKKKRKKSSEKNPNKPKQRRSKFVETLRELWELLRFLLDALWSFLKWILKVTGRD